MILMARAPKYNEAPLGSGSMFDSIAGQYDIVNRFLSLGMDMSWRKILLQELQLQPGDRVLDLATGTADVAILEGEALRAMAEAAASSGSKGAGKQKKGMVVGIDPSANMLAHGRDKVAAKGLDGIVKLQLGDAQALKELSNRSFDKISMSFGIRNVPDRAKALREIHRVAAPGATVAIMDLHAPTTGIFAPLGRAAVKFLPTVLGLLSGAPDQYGHLERSIFAFPEPDAWQDAMRDAGLPVYRAVPLCLGCVWLYLAHPAKK
ncbi:UbiE/COQ5 methyltransferase [Tribonema minus]|uniref:UbiE/COQ5 methyltransferase n=1 Tax=Tribonema minus TaxID=303371 RepID=A0A835YHX6_9STRA|nr:UbiE/COQ5 methyltransferase [Tribonema minus]